MTHLGKPLTRGEQRYVRRWLDRHDAGGRVATPLLAARLAARYRAFRIEGVVTAALFFGFLAWYLSGLTGDPDTDLFLVLLTVAYAGMSAGTLAALWYRRRADRAIGQALPRRVARSSAMDLRRLLGGWFGVAAAVSYGGGFAVGSLGLVTGVPPDRAVAAVFLAAVLVFGLFGSAVVADAARRPTVAEDELSLIDDAALRREDGHRALPPHLIMFALVAGLHSRSGDGLLLAYLGYVAGAGVALAVAAVLAARLRTGAAGVAAAVRP